MRRTKGEAQIRYHKLNRRAHRRGPRLFSTRRRELYVWSMDALQIGRKTGNEIPGGVAIRVGGCFPDWNLEELGDRCVLAGTVDCNRPHTHQACSDFLAEPEGEVWPSGAHLGELRLIKGRRTVAGPGFLLKLSGLSPEGVGLIYSWHHPWSTLPSKRYLSSSESPCVTVVTPSWQICRRFVRHPVRPQSQGSMASWRSQWQLEEPEAVPRQSSGSWQPVSSRGSQWNHEK